MFKTPFSYIFSCLLLFCLFSQAKEFTVFDQENASSWKLTSIINKVQAYHTPKNLFQIQGKSFQTVVWHQVIEDPVSSALEIEFQFDSKGIVSLNKKATCELILRNQAGEIRHYPLFMIEGLSDSQIGSLKIEHEEGFFLNEIRLNLAMSDEVAQAYLELKKLNIIAESNLPSSEEIGLKLQQKPFAHFTVNNDAYGRSQIFHGDLPIHFWGHKYLQQSTTTQEKLFQEIGIQYNRLSIKPGGKNGYWFNPDYFSAQALKKDLDRITQSQLPYNVIDIHLDQAPVWWSAKEHGPISHLNPKWEAYCLNALEYILFHIRKCPAESRIVVINLILSPNRNETSLPIAGIDMNPIWDKWLQRNVPNQKELHWEPAADDQAPFFGNLISPDQVDKRALKDTFLNSQWFAYVDRLTQKCSQYLHGKILTGFPNGPIQFLGTYNPKTLTDNIGIIKPFIESQYIQYYELDLSLNSTKILSHHQVINQLLAKHRKFLNLNVKLSGPAHHKFSEALQTLFYQSNITANGLCFSGKINHLWSRVNQHLLRELKACEIFTGASLGEAEDLKGLTVVLDPNVFKYYSPSENSQPIIEKQEHSQLFQRAIPYWFQTGLKVHVKWLGDSSITEDNLILFYHTMAYSGNSKTFLKSLQGSNRSIIQVWSNWMYDQGNWSPTNLKPLTGFEIKYSPKPSRFYMQPTQELWRNLKVTKLQSQFGMPWAENSQELDLKTYVAPTFFSLSGKQKVMATYLDHKNGALVTQNFPTWNSYYSASPCLNPEILQAIAKKTNLNSYLSQVDTSIRVGKVTYIQATQNKTQQLIHEKDTALYEVIRKVELPKAAVHAIKTEKGRNYLFFKGTQKEWENRF
ncbi:MAG: hypothetical protein MK193_05725 [Lentisphaeria bacterium]|nr:hypothetical protein [Lentisphaeria bacterium]